MNKIEFPGVLWIRDSGSSIVPSKLVNTRGSKKLQECNSKVHEKVFKTKNLISGHNDSLAICIGVATIKQVDTW